MGLRPAVGPGTRSLRGRRGLRGCPFASGPYDSLSILVGCPDPLWSVLHRLGVVRYGWDSRSDPVRTRWGASWLERGGEGGPPCVSCHAYPHQPNTTHESVVLSLAVARVRFTARPRAGSGRARRRRGRRRGRASRATSPWTAH